MITQRGRILVFNAFNIFNIAALALALTLALMLWGCGEETPVPTPTQATKETASQPEPLQFSQYLPGQPGSFWKYAAPDGTEVTRTVAGIEQVKTASYLVLKGEPAPQNKPTDEKALIVQTLLELPDIRYRGSSAGDVIINASDLRTAVDGMLRKKFDKNIKASTSPIFSLPPVEWILIKEPLSEGTNWMVMLASVSGTIVKNATVGGRTKPVSSSFSGSIEIKAQVTAEESIKTPAGTFDAIKVVYKMITSASDPGQNTPTITEEDLLTHWVVPSTGIVQSAGKDGKTWQLVSFETK